MTMTPDKAKGKGKDRAKLVRIAGLALSVVFELASGPVVGYYLGTYLAGRFAWDGRAVVACVVIGFLVGFYAVVMTLLKINEIDRKDPSA